MAKESHELHQLTSGLLALFQEYLGTCKSDKEVAEAVTQYIPAEAFIERYGELTELIKIYSLQLIEAVRERPEGLKIKIMLLGTLASLSSSANDSKVLDIIIVCLSKYAMQLITWGITGEDNLEFYM